jgi:hypothetical protein
MTSGGVLRGVGARIGARTMAIVGRMRGRGRLARAEVGDGRVAADAPRGRVVGKRRLLRGVERAQPQARALRGRRGGMGIVTMILLFILENIIV